MNQQALEIPCISEIPSQRFQPNHGYGVTILLLYLMRRKRRRIVRYVTAFFLRSFSFCSLLGGKRERGFFLYCECDRLYIFETRNKLRGIKPRVRDVGPGPDSIYPYIIHGMIITPNYVGPS